MHSVHFLFVDLFSSRHKVGFRFRYQSGYWTLIRQWNALFKKEPWEQWDLLKVSKTIKLNDASVRLLHLSQSRSLEVRFRIRHRNVFLLSLTALADGTWTCWTAGPWCRWTRRSWSWSLNLPESRNWKNVSKRSTPSLATMRQIKKKKKKSNSPTVIENNNINKVINIINNNNNSYNLTINIIHTQDFAYFNDTNYLVYCYPRFRLFTAQWIIIHIRIIDFLVLNPLIICYFCLTL